VVLPILTWTPSNSLTNEPAGNDSVFMHHTVREFFLSPDGCVAKSAFKMSKKDAHICISITCIRYLMLCVANVAKSPPDIKSWTWEHYESCAQYLNERPLANYALCYLKDHIDGCHGDMNVLHLVSQFLNELTCNPAVYLLERWVNSHLNKILLSSEESGAAEDFRNKILHAAATKGFSQAAEVLLVVGANADSKDKNGRTPLP